MCTWPYSHHGRSHMAYIYMHITCVLYACMHACMHIRGMCTSHISSLIVYIREYTHEAHMNVCIDGKKWTNVCPKFGKCV